MRQMMMARAVTWRSALAVLALTVVGLAACGPASAAPLEPVGEWQVEQADESCRLWRNFGTGDQATAFNIYTYGPDASYRIVLTGKAVMRDRGQAVESRVRFGSEVDYRPLAAVASRSGSDGMLSLLMVGNGSTYHFVRGWSPLGGWDWDRALIPTVEDFTSITVETGRMPAITLRLGDMSTPMAQLAECQGRLAESWGVATPAVQPVLTEARPLLERLAMPEGMVLNHVSLIAQIKVRVDPQGRATECEVQSPSLESRQTRGLCRPLLDFARFEPARDAAGNPVEAIFRIVYSYHIFD
ncbi:MAG: hypothetical protein ABIT10_00690 [Alteraurantiacibacter sp.]